MQPFVPEARLYRLNDHEISKKKKDAIGGLDSLIRACNAPKPSRKGVWLVGGAVRDAFQGNFMPKDLDYIASCRGVFEDTLSEKKSPTRTTDFAITWSHPLAWYNGSRIDVQLLNRNLGTPPKTLRQCLSEFDIRACQIAYDGVDIIALPHVLDDINSCAIKLSRKGEVCPVTTPARMVRFVARGWHLSSNTAQDLVNRHIIAGTS